MASRKCGGVVSTTKEPPLSASKANKVSQSSQSIVHVGLPSTVCGECSEIFTLEVGDDGDVEVGLLGEGWGLAVVVRSVAKLFTHEAI